MTVIISVKVNLWTGNCIEISCENCQKIVRCSVKGLMYPQYNTLRFFSFMMICSAKILVSCTVFLYFFFISAVFGPKLKFQLSFAKYCFYRLNAHAIADCLLWHFSIFTKSNFSGNQIRNRNQKMWLPLQWNRCASNRDPIVIPASERR